MHALSNWSNKNTWLLYDWICESNFRFRCVREAAKQECFGPAINTIDEINEAINESHPLRYSGPADSAEEYDPTNENPLETADIEEIAEFFIETERNAYKPDEDDEDIEPLEPLKIIPLEDGWQLKVVRVNHPLLSPDVLVSVCCPSTKTYLCSKYREAQEGIETLSQICLDHLSNKEDWPVDS